MKIIKVKRSAAGKAKVRPERALVVRGAAALHARETARPGLSASADTISASAGRMAALPGRLKVPILSAEEDDELVLLLDPQAPLVGRILALVLPRAGWAADEAGVSTERLDGLLKRHRKMERLAARAGKVKTRVSDSRRIVARVLKIYMDRVDEAVARLIRTLPEAEARDLREAYSAIEDKKAQIRDRVTALQRQTQTDTKAHREELAALSARADAVDTARKARRGRPVDPAAALAASALLQEDDPDRRGSTR